MFGLLMVGLAVGGWALLFKTAVSVLRKDDT